MNSAAQDNPRATLTGVVFLSLTTLGLVGLFARVVQLQLKPDPRLAETVGSRTAVQTEEPARGDLLDRRGRLLSVTRFAHRVVVDPTQVERARLAEVKRKVPITLEEIMDAIATASGRPIEEIGRELSGVMIENDSRREFLREIGWMAPEPEVPHRAPVHEAGLDDMPGASPIHELEAPVDPLATSPANPKWPVRYLPMSGVISDERAAALKARNFPGVSLERVPVREYPGGATVAPIVGRVGFDKTGTVGAELSMYDKLEGTPGRITFVRSAGGRPLWVSPGSVTPAIHGADVRLSIDLEIQRIAQEELFRGVHEYNAAGGRVVVTDPNTGEILAMVDITRPVPEAVEFPWAPVGKRPDAAAPEYVSEAKRYRVIADDKAREIHPALGHNRCVESVYEPGSTFKPFMWSIVTETGRLRPSDVLNTENGYWVTSYHREIRDVKAKASQTWHDVLVNSSNIGMGKGCERLSFAEMNRGVVRWGFGKKTGLPLAGESSGLVTPIARWKITSSHSVAFGNEVAVTPVQMVRAFAAFCRQGEAAGTMGPIRLIAAGEKELRADVMYRVVPAKVAMLARDAMGTVAENMETSLATRSGEKEWRYNIFGKSGTSKIPLGKAPDGFRLPHGTKGYLQKQFTTSFLAGGPTENPRLVVLVIIDDPGPELTHTNRAYGALTAGPVNRRIFERALTYLGVASSPGRAAEKPAKVAAAPIVEDVLMAQDEPPAYLTETLESDAAVSDTLVR